MSPVGLPELQPAPPARPALGRRFALLVLAVSLIVALPFLLWGEPEIPASVREGRLSTGGIVLIGVAALSVDAVAPVPATLVIALLARHGGLIAGITGGTAGLTLGVVGSWLVGNLAVRRIVPRWFTAAERARLERSLQRHSGWTLICLRSVPIAAETSVMLAAAAGMPLRRTLLITLAPNVVMAAIYSLAAQASWTAALITFGVTIVLSYAGWRLAADRGSGTLHAQR